MVLAVIPARGGSKGIPGKNVRLLNGKPLIYYSIQNALKCKWIDTVVVSSDDEEILKIARNYGVEIVERGSALAQDAVTLDPVIYDALYQIEKRTSQIYDVVVTLQPTSPLLSLSTLEKAIENFLQSAEYDTVISAVNKPHLSWTNSEGSYVPCYKERLNRQQLPPNYLETGAFLITKRDCMTPERRIGRKISIYEMPEEESIDIDNKMDWVLCEYELTKKRILFRVDGYKERGMGHIYRCLTLAYNLTGQDVVFVCKREHKEGICKLQASHMPLHIIEDDSDFFTYIEEWKPDIIINDCLDTDRTYMKELKSRVKKVVTIEDVGEGACFADIVINALYEDRQQGGNYYWGEKYVCLRDEFMLAKPAKYREKVRKVVVLFGGTDPSDFTGRIYKLAQKMHKNYPDVCFHFLTGVGYDLSQKKIANNEALGIIVEQDVKRMSEVIEKADVAFTSQGRTVYELAAMGVPAIVLAQNEREMRHTFAQMNNGFLNLGLGKNVSDETIENTLKFLLDTPQIRNEMRNLMLKHDLRKGIDRVIELILKENK